MPTLLQVSPFLSSYEAVGLSRSVLWTLCDIVLASEIFSYTCYPITRNVYCRWLHGKCEEICGEEMLEAAAENGFRCSLCRPQGNAPTSDALNVLVCDNVPMNRCALDVLHTKHGGSLFRSASVQEPLFDLPLHPFAARGHSFDG